MIEKKDTFTVFSRNILNEKFFAKWASKVKRMTLKKRSQLFNQSVNNGPISKADICVFQEWPAKTTNQAKSWGGYGTPLKKKFYVLVGGEILIAVNTKKFDKNSIKKAATFKTTTHATQNNALAVILKNKATNKFIGIVGTHFKGGNPTGNYNQFRIDQSKKILEQINKINPNIPWIITGDFNWYDQKLVEQTFAGYKNTNPNHLSTSRNPKSKLETIDYMLYNPKNLQIVKFGIKPKPNNQMSKLLPHNQDSLHKNYDYSDHAGLIAKFKIQEKYIKSPKDYLEEKNIPKKKKYTKSETVKPKIDEKTIRTIVLTARTGYNQKQLLDMGFEPKDIAEALARMDLVNQIQQAKNSIGTSHWKTKVRKHLSNAIQNIKKSQDKELITTAQTLITSLITSIPKKDTSLNNLTSSEKKCDSIIENCKKFDKKYGWLKNEIIKTVEKLKKWIEKKKKYAQ